MSFRLVPKWVTLTELKRLIGLMVSILPNSIAFRAQYVKVVEDTPILSASGM